MKDGKASYVHNWFGRELYTVTSPKSLAPGKATIRYDFTYEGGKEMGKGGTSALFVNGTKVAEGKVANTIPNLISADETADVGADHHTPVTPEYAQHGNDFTGKIEKVTIDLK